MWRTFSKCEYSADRCSLLCPSAVGQIGLTDKSEKLWLDLLYYKKRLDSEMLKHYRIFTKFGMPIQFVLPYGAKCILNPTIGSTIIILASVHQYILQTYPRFSMPN